ncbi:SAM-dependent methyltransferase [Streptomyces sp. UNOB3_S3]|uniref:SAM-dependent methyltransferase n=1 Tax=Streptomyces sp. UNOB3_S3 TaxID=2871682 RepID=UPI001E3B21CC|nr:SAM-dependent methyltransferase [Streptomyces sp. UNOB3_S3]MCC3779604.1 SAM-dependent methyltransferase [Streptomyces sp. UNOB3_S3]
MSKGQQWDVVSGVGITALAVAAARAVETGRPDALIEDPYARGFVGAARAPVKLPTTPAEAEAADGRGYWAQVSTYIAVRTRAFDDYFRQAAEAGVTQAVLLASGLDTRAFRLPWPERTVVYEIDQPLVLDFKLTVLREHGATAGGVHRPVGADLREDWPAALEAAGFDRARPTAWLAEGLLPYLPSEAEESLFHEIHRLSAPGSRLAVEAIGNIPGALADTAANGSVRTLGVDLADLIHTGQRPAPADRLTNLGWNVRTVPATETAAEHGRPLSPAFVERDARYVFADRPPRAIASSAMSSVIRPPV